MNLEMYFKFFVLLNCLFQSVQGDPYEFSECTKPTNERELQSNTFFQFEVDTLNYSVFNFKKMFEGRVMFAVNVASF